MRNARLASTWSTLAALPVAAASNGCNSRSGPAGGGPALDFDSGASFDGTTDSPSGDDAGEQDASVAKDTGSTGADSSSMSADTGVAVDAGHEAAASDSGNDASPAPDAAADAGSCPPSDAGAPQTLCNGVCVDTASDPSNCGACGNVCAVPAAPSTMTCALGGCLVTLATSSFPNGIAVDSANVYWTTVPSPSGGTVLKIPKTGGAPATLASGLYSPGGIAVSGTNAYWTSQDPAGTNSGVIVQTVPLSGGTPTSAADVLLSAIPGDIRLDSNNVYWSVFDYTNGAILRAPLDGGAVATLASGETYPLYMTIDGTHAYWTDSWHPGSVVSVPLAGGTPTTLAAGQNSTAGIAVDGTGVYWDNGNVACLIDGGACGLVQKQSLDGGAPITLASGVYNPQGMAVDVTYLYWTDWGSFGTVMRVPVGGGTPTTIAAGQGKPTYLAVDAAGVYWTNLSNGGTVMMLAK